MSRSDFVHAVRRWSAAAPLALCFVLTGVACGSGIAGSPTGGASTSASTYKGRPASQREKEEIIASARATEICGWHGQIGQLSHFRVVAYQTQAISIKWASVGWTPPDGQVCELIFLEVSSKPYFHAGGRGLHPARVQWFPFTWGSAPFAGASTYSDHEWNGLSIGLSPPRWDALTRALLTGY